MLFCSFLEKITSGEIAITAEQFPNFLYDEDLAVPLNMNNLAEWDVEKGLLRSDLCLWVRA
jgi:hypothetical protein